MNTDSSERRHIHSNPICTEVWNFFAGNKMSLEQFSNRNRKKFGYYRTINRMICNDVFSVSIQCEYLYYCTPRREFDDPQQYNSFELGFPSHADVLLPEYPEDKQTPTYTVYAYVPRSVVEKLIKNHSGIKQ